MRMRSVVEKAPESFRHCDVDCEVFEVSKVMRSQWLPNIFMAQWPPSYEHEIQKKSPSPISVLWLRREREGKANALRLVSCDVCLCTLIIGHRQVCFFHFAVIISAADFWENVGYFYLLFSPVIICFVCIFTELNFGLGSYEHVVDSMVRTQTRLRMYLVSGEQEL